ncbi:MAG: hypothetical protein ACJ72W_02900 [Actinoallomurus sp.]
MASNLDALEPIDVDLGDGRKLKVRPYGNGEVTFEISGGPYVLSQFFMPAHDTIVKLSPGKQGSNVPKKY